MNIDFVPKPRLAARGRLGLRALDSFTNSFRLFVKSVVYRGRVPLSWHDERNWGDALNPVLVSLLSGRPVRQVHEPEVDRYLVIGSILAMADARTEVWGSGFIRDGQVLAEAPKRIHAVRGPLTRAALLKAGIECPEVYGDPALLLPRFFNPDVAVEYDVGVIPHVVDKNHPWIHKCRSLTGVRIIDVEAGTWDFVRAVKSCRVILSSSLHGLVCADAYGIPNAWIRLSDKVLGGDFKFRDYRLSIGAAEPVAVVISERSELAPIAAAAQLHPLRIDLKLLLASCPFLSESLRGQLEAGA